MVTPNSPPDSLAPVAVRALTCSPFSSRCGALKAIRRELANPAVARAVHALKLSSKPGGDVLNSHSMKPGPSALYAAGKASTSPKVIPMNWEKVNASPSRSVIT